MDKSPHDRIYNMCGKSKLSDGDQRITCCHVEPPGAFDRHRGLIKDASDRNHRTAGIIRDTCDRGAPCGSRSDRPRV